MSEMSELLKTFEEAAYVGEGQLVKSIRLQLLTAEQDAWLHRGMCSIEDVLNGRYPLDCFPAIKSVLFDPWNAKLGAEFFRGLFQET